MAKDPPIRKTCKRYDVPNGVHAINFNCFQQKQFLRSDRTRLMFADSLAKAKATHGFHVWGYVLMPEHVHLLLFFPMEKYSISAMLLSLKQSVARKAIHYLRKDNPDGLRALATGQKHTPYRFWMDGGGFDRNIHTDDTLHNALVYIHANPVKRGLVRQPQDWYWSSASDWLTNVPGPIPLDKDSFPIITG